MSSQLQNHLFSSTLDREIADFLIDRESRNLTQKSLSWYKHSLKIFSAYLTAQNTATTANVTASNIRHFIIYLKDQGHNPGGRANIFGAVRAYLRWYGAEHELVGWHPLDKIATPKRGNEIQKPIELSDFQALLDVCRGRGFAALRDRAILMVLLDTGIRKQEMVDLNHGDVNFDNGEIYVRSGKGRKSRAVFVGVKTKRSLSAYLRTRNKLDGDSPLWATEAGGRLAYHSIRQMIRRRAAEAGIKEPGLYEFRRAFAVNYLRNGGDVITLQRMLGHTSLTMTTRYLALLSDDLRAAHAAHSPVDNLT